MPPPRHSSTTTAAAAIQPYIRRHRDQLKNVGHPSSAFQKPPGLRSREDAASSPSFALRGPGGPSRNLPTSSGSVATPMSMAVPSFHYKKPSNTGQAPAPALSKSSDGIWFAEGPLRVSSLNQPSWRWGTREGWWQRHGRLVQLDIHLEFDQENLLDLSDLSDLSLQLEHSPPQPGGYLTAMALVNHKLHLGKMEMKELRLELSGLVLSAGTNTVAVMLRYPIS